MAVILGSGAGLTGRIPMRIREQEGLAYTAYAQTVAGAGLDAGRLVAYLGTAPATVDQAETGVKEEIARLIEDGVEEAVLAGPSTAQILRYAQDDTTERRPQTYPSRSLAAVSKTCRMRHLFRDEP